MPADFLFTILGQLTGGFVTDIQTLLAAFVVLGFLKFGAEILIEKLQGAASSRFFGKAQTFYELRNASAKGSMEYDYYNAMYRSNLNQSLAFRQKSGGDVGNFYIGLGSTSNENTSSGSTSSFQGGHDTEFDSLAAQGDSLEDLFPELQSSGPAAYDDDPGYSDGDRPYWA